MVRLAPLLIVVAVLAVAPDLDAKDRKKKRVDSGSPSLAFELPDEAVSDGTWDGTWMYVNRHHRFALWLRTDGARPEAKLRYQSMGSAESFITDWSGYVEYAEKKGEGVFSFRIDRADDDLIVGDWYWHLEFPTTYRTESSPVRVFRLGDGRMLRIEFPQFVRVVFQRGQRAENRVSTAWTFRKVSRRHLLWDELPF